MTWDKTKPTNSTKLGSLSAEIRNNWDALEDNIKVDHYEMGDTDDGKHRKVTLKATTNPTAVADNDIIFSKDVANPSGSTKPELHIIDEDSNVIQLTEEGEVLANRLKAVSSTELELTAADGEDVEIVLGDSAGSNKVSIKSASYTISAATKANPCKITATAHDLSTADVVRIVNVEGMVELNNANYTITKVDANNFTLDSTDSSLYTTYTSGGAFCVEKVSFNSSGDVTVANDLTVSGALSTSGKDGVVKAWSLTAANSTITDSFGFASCSETASVYTYAFSSAMSSVNYAILATPNTSSTSFLYSAVISDKTVNGFKIRFIISTNTIRTVSHSVMILGNQA